MASIREMYNRVKDIDTEEVIGRVFEKSKDELKRVNQAQLYEGYNRKGKRLNKYARPRYARVKNEMNSLPGYGNPDFYVTGEFYRGWEIDIQGRRIITDLGSGGKVDFLFGRDPDITGLGGEYKKRAINETLYPAFIAGVREKLMK